MTYKLINLEQNSDEWLDWRKNGWSASETGTIMLKTASTWDDLRLAKAGLQEHSEHTKKLFRHGHEQEEVAREWFNKKKTPHSFQPACLENRENPKIRASLDGFLHIDANHPEFLEIKSPMQMKAKKRWYDSVSSYDDLPPHYKWQLIHQFAAIGTDIALAHYLIWLGQDEHIYFQHQFNRLLLNYEMQTLVEQWEKFERDEPSGNSDPEWKQHAEAWLQAKAVKSEAEKKMAKAREALIYHSLGKQDTHVSHGCGVNVITGVRKGGFDLDMMEEDGIDLEKYRKPDSSYHMIKEKK